MVLIDLVIFLQRLLTYFEKVFNHTTRSAKVIWSTIVVLSDVCSSCYPSLEMGASPKRSIFHLRVAETLLLVIAL
jgi:hypothetical protein